jgi:hypothetical protein
MLESLGRWGAASSPENRNLQTALLGSTGREGVLHRSALSAARLALPVVLAVGAHRAEHPHFADRRYPVRNISSY